MGSRYEVELTIVSARDLKNVNWRHGELVAYAVAWVDDGPRVSTRADHEGGTNPVWDEKLCVPVPPDARLDDAVLRVDVVHAGPAAEGTKPLVGSARLPLRHVLDDVGIGSKSSRTLPLKRPSGRPHGFIDLKLAVRDAAPPRPRYYDPYAAPPPYAQSRDYRPGDGSYAQPYGQPYGQPYAVPPPAGYPYDAPPPPPPQYGSAAYGGAAYGGAAASAPAYGGAAPYGVVEEKKKSKFGMGTGLAVGAAAGLLGGLAISEGVDYMENKISDEAADKVEDDLAYDDGCYGGDDF
ncbi:protein SRC2 homolog [Ananas comosus]|uniref:Protein SRC n=1 Tax=Ananas comosus TaxID=4615 RepID=A0A199UQG4_ANACO|nr:protein SRC2 homolog [Ananas comosus]OAY67062.1 Protein SRC [Ananas comosus]